MTMSDTELDALAVEFSLDATHAAVYTTIPTTNAAGTEPTGGSPAYARKPISWVGPNAVGPLGSTLQPALHGVIYFQVTFDVLGTTGSTLTLRGAGVHGGLTGSNYKYGGAITAFNTNAQATYTLNGVYTQA